MRRKFYREVIKNLESYLAIGEKSVYLDDPYEELPWDRIVRVDVAGMYRLDIPVSCVCIAEEGGMEFRWRFDFEDRDANGSGVSKITPERFRDFSMRLPAPARKTFAKILSEQVLPPMKKRAAEIRDALQNQLDSEECVRWAIAFAGA